MLNALVEQRAIAAVAAVAFVGACCPDSPPAVPLNDSGYTPVATDAYQTYRSYSGYRRSWMPEAQFTTPAGIRCRIGTNSPEYDGGPRCWGSFPDGNNHAMVSAYAYDTETHELLTARPIPPDRVAYSFVGRVDDLSYAESYLDPAQQRHAVDPADYHLLEAGHLISVTDQSAWTSVCAVDTDAVTCEIRKAEDGNIHGFQVSASGSRTY